MADVSFNEEQSLPPSVLAQSTRKKTGITGLVITSGLAKTEGQANLMLILIALLALSGAAYAFWSTTPQTYVPTPEDLRMLEAMKTR